MSNSHGNLPAHDCFSGRVSKIAALEAHNSDERQYEDVECYPEEECRCYRLRGGERRIKTIGREPQQWEDLRGREQEEGGAVPEGIGRYNQVDNGANILQGLALGRPDDLYNELHDAGYGSYNEEHQHYGTVDDGGYEGTAYCSKPQQCQHRKFERAERAQYLLRPVAGFPVNNSQ